MILTQIKSTFFQLISVFIEVFLERKTIISQIYNYSVVQLRGNFHEVSITGLEVASLQEQYNQHCLRECPRVIKDPFLPPTSLFLLVP